MAALLRSARFLRLSPSGSLQISGTKRTGPALSRLYSGALSAISRAGVCPRQIRLASENACSRVWPHIAAGVCSYLRRGHGAEGRVQQRGEVLSRRRSLTGL
ncbi:hypothetical protein E3U43_009568 [Larimichthys crocea]|uniref:Uncharacterized protein n=1 Tax=Larimichthys crocea TaxID=215358 RepID=A0ACD3QCL6_LARCR|nr:hypothetical protein E3U43_009568 [Larimichthys crocea]